MVLCVTLLQLHNNATMIDEKYIYFLCNYNDNDNDNEFLFRRMKRKKIVIHEINLQNKYAYIVKEITLIHKCRWHVSVTTLKQRVDCNIINR